MDKTEVFLIESTQQTTRRVMNPFYNQSTEETLQQLSSSPKGLSTSSVTLLQQQFGPNALKEGAQRTKLALLLAQFMDVMILILVVAAVVSFSFGEHTDAFVILAIIIANAWMGYAQESKAEDSIRMLTKMAAHYAIALRDGHPSKIEAKELVPGDIITIEAGDIVPADARLLEVFSLKTDEASLTGESHSIEKVTRTIDGDGLVPGDQLNMLFKGTIVSNGSAKAVVTSTGMDTELGKIAGLLQVGMQKTPLQKRLIQFSKQLAVIVVVICALVFGFGMYRGEPPFQMFLTALSLAVAALPEALPAVITIALARGAGRMVQQKALMRNLPAVETLGSVTYICTDKTGTLTQNIMTVEKVQAEEGKEHLLFCAMILDNEVKYSDKDELMGDATETAMVAHAIGSGLAHGEAEAQFPSIGKLPFDSERMRMSTLHAYGDKWVLFVKGAPQKITEAFGGRHSEQIEGLLETNREWASEGLRVLFFGCRFFDVKPEVIDVSLEKEIDFLGMIALIDPPREEVVAAIRQCKTAGIRTVMITGDQPLTAKAIAERLEIIEKDGEVRTGAELEKLSEEEFARNVGSISVYARVTPEQKLKIVKALQVNGEFVAMTGDGVNDAPSLKQADIGVAMGITGSDVTKEAADMILLDDHFTTIVKAVREGRRIYDNIRKFVLYVLSCNLSEILIIFLAPLFGFVIPLLPTHILWINLVTDGLPGIALVSEPAEKDVMHRPPRPPKENLFAGGLLLRIVLSSFVMTAACFIVLWWAEEQGHDVRLQQTMVFTTLCLVQLANALSVRSFFHPLFSSGLFSNRWMWIAIIATIILQAVIIYVPFLQEVFKTSALQINDILMITAVTAASLLFIELIKYISKLQHVKKMRHSFTPHQ